MANTAFGEKILKNQVFRFVVSAGAGFLVDMSAFYLFYHNILTQKRYHIIFVDIHNYWVSFSISFFLGVLVNFLITRYFVFNESTSSLLKQFTRFVSVAVLGYFANLAVLTFFVEDLHFYPPVARVTAALSLFFASFFIHKFFSFSLALRYQTPGKMKR
jgi:putative flippase GtrA